MPRKKTGLHHEFGGKPDAYQAPYEIASAIMSMMASQEKTIRTPQLQNAAAISLRQRFYKWRVKVLEQFVDIDAPRHFRTTDCDKYLAQEIRGLTTDILQRINIKMEPILSVRAQFRVLIFSIRPEMEFMEVLKDGTLRPVNLAVDQLPVTQREHVWDFGNGVTVPIQETIGKVVREPTQEEKLETEHRHKIMQEYMMKSPEEQAALIAAARERDRLADLEREAALRTTIAQSQATGSAPAGASQAAPAEDLPPSPPSAKPQWVIDLELAQEREKNFTPPTSRG